MAAPASVTYRRVADDDLDFLRRLYRSTREAELEQTGWTESQKADFIGMQFHAQHTFYQQQFPDARFDLILDEAGGPIGRLYVDYRLDEHRLIDIALLPECRGKGLGTRLMEEVLDRAKADGKVVRIHVEQFNPALRLYQRLGFRHIEDQGVYFLMEWAP